MVRQSPEFDSQIALVNVLEFERCNDGKWRWHCYGCGETGKKKKTKALVNKNEHVCTKSFRVDSQATILD